MITKTEKIFFAFLFVAGVACYYFHSYWSGVISGACWGITIISLLGKKLFNEATRRADKRMKDILTDDGNDE